MVPHRFTDRRGEPWKSGQNVENTYDLYYFDQTGGNNGAEWKNWKQGESNDDPNFNLVSGKGYLYANSDDVTLTFTGSPYSGDGKVTLTKIEGASFEGWNLVGNPFGETAYIDRDFFVMNTEGSEIEVAERIDIAPMEGIFVYAEYDDDEVEFTTQEPGKGRGPKPELEQVVLNLSRKRGNIIDRAIVRMGEGQTLPKFQIWDNSTKLYIPQNGKDYAIATSNGYGEMPVNFKAKENDTYTISVNPKNVEMAYLHLIDNMTGVDVDLLATPTYTFTAKTTDYESRFKLVFVSEDANDNDDVPFAFISNGSIIVNGEGTLQVIDMMGRVVVSIDGHTRCVPTAEMVPGVYVLRLINGENVRTQKMVIE